MIPTNPSSMPAGSHGMILIAEDEDEIAEILSAFLLRSGLRSVHARNGKEALALHQSHQPDLVLLDVQMPEIDGWRVLSEIRLRGTTPVIMLTALDQDIDKLMGLRIGADDYVVKPFNPAEVVARVQAVLRRSSLHTSTASSSILRVKPFEINLHNHEVILDLGGKTLPLELTLTEFKLLVHLASAPRQVFSRATLIENCLPEGNTLERTVDSHLSKLRKKLEQVGIMGIPSGVRGVGYRLWGQE
ncbi:response regulator [Leeia sp. TBRC 13508]|uniref:Response regulator n=1 Tax=Leeia speluncae TaxID=2884804 RepID=A0ABS8D7N6_9NEIS|nr:response regulator [Leeia speluncae]MCB6184200.1 response regulator [Leeia speluncae]